MYYCTNCRAALPNTARFCSTCGSPQQAPLDAPPDVVPIARKSPGTAAFLELLFPGLGYMYAGAGGVGLVMFLVTIVFGGLSLAILSSGTSGNDLSCLVTFLLFWTFARVATVAYAVAHRDSSSSR